MRSAGSLSCTPKRYQIRTSISKLHQKLTDLSVEAYVQKRTSNDKHVSRYNSRIYLQTCLQQTTNDMQVTTYIRGLYLQTSLSFDVQDDIVEDVARRFESIFPNRRSTGGGPKMWKDTEKKLKSTS